MTHNRPAGYGPSLSHTITKRLIITAIVAIWLQFFISSYQNIANPDDVYRNYVGLETREILSGIESTNEELKFKLPVTAHHYLRYNSTAYAFRILLANGQELAAVNGDWFSKLSPWPSRDRNALDLWIQKAYFVQSFGVIGGERLKVANQEVWIEVATKGDPAHVHWRSIRKDIYDDVVIPMVPLTLLLLFVAIHSTRTSLRPLVNAAQRADETVGLGRSERFETAGMPREAASFAEAINRLLDRVDLLLRSQKLFLACAAHELRTPLAVMLLEIEKISHPRAERLLRDVIGMSNTVDRLLVLSSLETYNSVELEEIDLNELAVETVERLSTLARIHGRHVIVHNCGSSILLGDRIALREMLRNLIENAIRHAEHGSHVFVRVGPGPTVCVEDDGRGFPPGDPSDYMKAFQKGNQSADGSGLGLTIVQQAVNLHKGQVEIGRSAAGGARVVVTFD